MDKVQEMIISEVFLMTIPANQKLAALYQKWCELSEPEKQRLDYQALMSFPTEAKMLYHPMIDALKRWDFIQETEGAPGCVPGLTISAGDNPLTTGDIELMADAVLMHVEAIIEKRAGKAPKPKSEDNDLDEALKMLESVTLGMGSDSGDSNDSPGCSSMQ